MGKRNVESFCLCLAVRQGLLIWGYTKLVLSLVVTICFTCISVQMFGRVSESYDNALTFLQCVTTIVPELLDLIFTLILIISTHKRNLKMLEVYYFYSITMLAVYILVLLLTSCNMEKFRILHDMIFHHSWVLKLNYYVLVGFGAANICLQTYLMLLVKSEVVKQKDVKKAILARQKSSTSFRGLRVGLTSANSRANVYNTRP